MQDGMETQLTPVYVVTGAITGANCSACSSLTHLSADFPIVLKTQEKVSVQHSVLQKQSQAAWEREKKR